MVHFAAPENVHDLLQGMVRIDSVNAAISGRRHAEDQLRDWLQEIAVSWGFATRRLPVEHAADQLLITHEADPAAPWVLFDSHLDTVGALGMTVEPFGGLIDGDRLFGRGACDTKGTGAAMLWALKEHAATSGGAEGANNVALLFSVDEESGMAGIRSFTRRDLPRLPFRVAAAIVGEPTMCHPVIAHNGVVRWTVRTIGKASHSSVPHEGRSAISMMCRVIEAIESRYIPGLSASHPRTGQAVCSINLIRGGSGINVIPERCEIEIDRRLVPGEVSEAAVAEVEALLRELGVEHETEVDVTHPPLRDDANGPLAEHAQRILREMSLPAMCVGAPFATHGAYLAEAGVATIVIGPGDPHPAHTKDEWVSLAAIRQGVELYLRFMRTPLAV